MKNIRGRLAAACLSLAGLGAAFAVHAEDDRFTVHGFGNQDYSKSSANSFENSGPSGTWNNNFLGLVVSATVNEQSKVWAQLQANSTEQARFTWMFVDYEFSEDTTGHIGRVKFPYGIYNEIIDTRALQWSVSLPLIYAGETDFTYDAYNGIGVDHRIDLGKNGRLLLQGFAGNIYVPPNPTSNPPFPAQAGLANLVAITNDHHVVGGKITWETPVEGLRLLVSANQTLVVTTADNGQVPNQGGHENRIMLSVDYIHDALDLKAEYNYHKYPGLAGFDNEKSKGWYVQAGWESGNWKPYARFDAVVLDQDASSDPSYYQRSLVLGIGRRIASNLNFRIEDAFNHGYALPVAAGETAIGAGKTNWQLYSASINFMF